MVNKIVNKNAVWIAEKDARVVFIYSSMIITHLTLHELNSSHERMMLPHRLLPSLKEKIL